MLIRPFIIGNMNPLGTKELDTSLAMYDIGALGIVFALYKGGLGRMGLEPLDGFYEVLLGVTHYAFLLF
jgi:hypothetical protein